VITLRVAKTMVLRINMKMKRETLRKDLPTVVYMLRKKSLPMRVCIYLVDPLPEAGVVFPSTPSNPRPRCSLDNARRGGYISPETSPFHGAESIKLPHPRKAQVSNKFRPYEAYPASFRNEIVAAIRPKDVEMQSGRKALTT